MHGVMEISVFQAPRSPVLQHGEQFVRVLAPVDPVQYGAREGALQGAHHHGEVAHLQKEFFYGTYETVEQPRTTKYTCAPV